MPNKSQSQIGAFLGTGLVEYLKAKHEVINERAFEQLLYFSLNSCLLLDAANRFAVKPGRGYVSFRCLSKVLFMSEDAEEVWGPNPSMLF